MSALTVAVFEPRSCSTSFIKWENLSRTLFRKLQPFLIPAAGSCRQPCHRPGHGYAMATS